MAVRPQRLTINPSLGDSINGLVVVEAEELGNDRRGGNLDKHDVIQAYSVVRVEKS